MNRADYPCSNAASHTCSSSGATGDGLVGSQAWAASAGQHVQTDADPLDAISLPTRDEWRIRRCPSLSGRHRGEDLRNAFLANRYGGNRLTRSAYVDTEGVSSVLGSLCMVGCSG